MNPEQEMQAEYWADVRCIANYIAVEECSDENDAIHEAVDGSQWVIYTHRALRVLQYSRNHDAGLDEMGKDLFAGVEDMSTLYSRAAYFAMAADVRDAIVRVVASK
jgi:hypothetical protein